MELLWKVNLSKQSEHDLDLVQIKMMSGQGKYKSNKANIVKNLRGGFLTHLFMINDADGVDIK